MISTYFNLMRPRREIIEEFGKWVATTSAAYSGIARAHFDAAAAQVVRWLESAPVGGRSAAVYARCGDHPFFLPLTFKAALKDEFFAENYPAIYPLVEMKDRFHRFVVAMVTADSGRIFEITLGETSLELLANRPAGRERTGREWTREHYQTQHHELDRRFVKEKVGLIEQLMSKRGHNALILAGEPRYVSRLHDALPAALKKKVVSQLRGGISDSRIAQILDDSVASFLSAEQDEAEGVVSQMVRAYRTSGLAAFGVDAALVALHNGQVEQLAIAADIGAHEREELVRLATLNSVPIETVRSDSMLVEHGGVGVLLRYLHPQVDPEHYGAA